MKLEPLLEMKSVAVTCVQNALLFPEIGLLQRYFLHLGMQNNLQHKHVPKRNQIKK
jgi:bacterioferritin (cytochrome b1)